MTAELLDVAVEVLVFLVLELLVWMKVGTTAAAAAGEVAEEGVDGTRQEVLGGVVMDG